MRDDDVVVFILCRNDGKLEVAESINAFTVRDLRATQDQARLGPPKSAAEGAERDLTWPSWTPGRSGIVTEIEGSRTAGDLRVTVQYDSGRRYTYPAGHKSAHVAAGEHFEASERIVASIVPGVASLECAGAVWNPDLSPALDDGDLYTSLKGLAGHDADDHADRLQEVLSHDDPRIRLEAAGVLVRLNRAKGLEYLEVVACGTDDEAPWAMEAVFIIAESGIADAGACLARLAAGAPHPEVRAACVWGLRRFHAQQAAVLDAFGDADEVVRLHAVSAAAGQIQEAADTGRLLELLNRAPNIAASACEALVLSPGTDDDAVLALAVGGDPPASDWAFSILKRRPKETVMAARGWASLPAAIMESLRCAWFWREQSWLASADVAESRRFLGQQQL
jgi:hypothetical protein